MANGQQLYDLGIKHIREKYQLGALVPKNDSKYIGPWDCAEFTSWLVYQVAGFLYGCANNQGNPASADAYTGFWGRDAEELGIKISINEAFVTPGAALLRLAGNGLIGHIVISDGNGGTVEAHSKNVGVTRSKISGRRWDYGVLVPGILYTKNNLPDVKDLNKKPVGKIYRFTKPLMRGEAVEKIQRALKIQVDGVFGMKTFNAVRAFQAANGLVADGEVGQKTLKALKIEL